jgi:hypothetical protein
VIISPLISQAGYVPGTFKANIRRSFIENIDFSFHTFELKTPLVGWMKVRYPNFFGFNPENRQGHEGIVVCGVVTFNFEENPLSIKYLRLGNSSLSNKS